MNTIKYYLFISTGLLALILGFFIDVTTQIGVLKEYVIIFHFNLEEYLTRFFYLQIYIITYYLIKIVIIISLFIPFKRIIIKLGFAFFILSMVSGYFVYINDYRPVWITYIPYLVSMIAWLYLGLTTLYSNEKHYE